MSQSNDTKQTVSLYQHYDCTNDDCTDADWVVKSAPAHSLVECPDCGEHMDAVGRPYAATPHTA
jgi:predicted RNA-binding Zn-ribbon protein involved in translation (DUF1610 family)